MNKIQTAISAGGLIIKDGKILLVKQNKGSNKSLWMLPGGFVEPGESIEAAAAREVFEESHIKAEIESIVAIRTGVRIWNNYDQSNIYIVYKMNYIDGNEKPDYDEISDVKFMSFEEIDKSNNIVGLSKDAISKYKSEGLRNMNTNFKINNQYKEYRLYL